MLFSGIELKVYQVDNTFVCAKSKEEALKCCVGLNDISNGTEIKECNLNQQGIYKEYTLESIMETIKCMGDEEIIKIKKVGTTEEKFYIWTSFADVIWEKINKDGALEVSKEPFIIA